MKQLIYKGLYDSKNRQYTVGENAADHVFYCDYPGERLFERVEFEINGNKLDEYNHYSYVFNRQFRLK